MKKKLIWLERRERKGIKLEMNTAESKNENNKMNSKNAKKLNLVVEDDEPITQVEAIATALKKVELEAEAYDNDDKSVETKKSVEEDEEETDEQLDAQIKIMLEKKRARELKKVANDRAGELVFKLKENKLIFIDKCKGMLREYENTMARLTSEMEGHINDYEELTGLDMETDDVMGYLMEWHKEFVEEQVENWTAPKPVAVKTGGGGAVAVVEKKVNAKGKELKGTRKAIDREETRKRLYNGMILKASANRKGTQDKVTLYVMYNGTNFIRYIPNSTGYQKTKYEKLQDANREWCNDRGLEKLGNAWEDFKAYSLKTGSVRSIANLNDDDWLSENENIHKEYCDLKALNSK